jgi:hypothetical protein
MLALQRRSSRRSVWGTVLHNYGAGGGSRTLMGQAARDFEFPTPGPASPQLRTESHTFEGLSNRRFRVTNRLSPMMTDSFDTVLANSDVTRLQFGSLPPSVISASGSVPLGVPSVEPSSTILWSTRCANQLERWLIHSSRSFEQRLLRTTAGDGTCPPTALSVRRPRHASAGPSGPLSGRRSSSMRPWPRPA